MKFPAETKLKDIKQFPNRFIEAFQSMGINTVMDLQAHQPEELANIVWKEGDGKDENPEMIGGKEAQRLLQQFELDKPTGVTVMPGRYVYMASTARTLTIRGRGQAYRPDGAGGVQNVTTTNPVHIAFEGGRGGNGIFVLNAMVAESHGLSLDEMREMIEGHDQFNKAYGFRLVAAPEEEAVIEKATSRKKRNTRGARGTGAL